MWHFPHLVRPGTELARPIHATQFYRYGIFITLGVRWCYTCSELNTHLLVWPRDAFYQAAVKRTRVFACDRADWRAIREFLAAPNRRELYRNGLAPWCVRYLPAPVIAAKNRKAVVEAMDKVLAAD